MNFILQQKIVPGQKCSSKKFQELFFSHVQRLKTQIDDQTGFSEITKSFCAASEKSKPWTVWTPGPKVPEVKVPGTVGNRQLTTDDGRPPCLVTGCFVFFCFFSAQSVENPVCLDVDHRYGHNKNACSLSWKQTLTPGQVCRFYSRNCRRYCPSLTSAFNKSKWDSSLTNKLTPIFSTLTGLIDVFILFFFSAPQHIQRRWSGNGIFPNKSPAIRPNVSVAAPCSQDVWMKRL